MRKQWENLSEEEILKRAVKNLQVTISINRRKIADAVEEVKAGKNLQENAKIVAYYRKVNTDKEKALAPLLEQWNKIKPQGKGKIQIDGKEIDAVLKEFAVK